MKKLSHHLSWLAACAAMSSLPLQGASETPGQVDFGKLPMPASGGECVEVHLRSNLIMMAARLVEKQEPEIGELTSRPQTGARPCSWPG